MPHFFEGFDFAAGSLVTCIYGTSDAELSLSIGTRPLIAGTVYKVLRKRVNYYNMKRLVIVDAKNRAFPRFVDYVGDDNRRWCQDFDVTDHSQDWFEPFVSEVGAKKFFECLDADYPLAVGF